MANPGADSRELDQLCINTIRTLSMDAVQAANSGHPGTPMALAPLAYVIWTRHLKHNPADPKWVDRDRFILSAGHASMLLYSLLYLSGYGLTLDDLKNFRQWESKTPGHPEYGMTDGVETTTGPLGQGFANGVGMAMAEAHVAAVHNRPDHPVIDHYVYAICSDGDLMEGVAAEAASVAGHLKLGKLIYFWDDNRITIEGDTELAFTENVEQRFEAYGWHTQRVEDGNDLEAIDAAIRAAQADPRPSMISVRTIIGFGSPNKAGSEKAHGEPLGAEEIVKTKQNLGWPSIESFHVPQEALDHMRETGARGAERQREWQARFDAYRAAHPDAAAALEQALSRTLPEGWDADLPTWTKDDKPIATRAASGKALNAIAKKVNWLIGGSADLAGSNNTMIEGAGSFLPPDYTGRNLHFGVREHAMGSLMNGMTLHGGVRVYGGTFLIFSEYMRPPVRLAALMEQPAIYIYTHDSVGLGEDGPTHQPIEQLPSLRTIPGLIDLRPADANETVEAWRFAMEHREGPVFFALTRQALPHIDRETMAPASGLRRGAYVLADAEGGDPQAILLASGSEVAVALEARIALEADGIPTRVVSMPSWALFAQQPKEYRDEVIPPAVKARVAIEAAHPMGWHRWVGEGEVIGISHFGASAPATRVFQELGFSAENVAAKAKGLLGIGSGHAQGAGDAGPTAHGTDEHFRTSTSRTGESDITMAETKHPTDAVRDDGNPLHELHALGQSVWLDYIRRGILDNGELEEMIRRYDLRGVTSNPSIFEQAIGDSTDYDDAVGELAASWAGASAAYESLAVEDIRRACDLFHGVYDEAKGHDGFVSLEVSPELAHDTRGTLEEARRLREAVDRPNLMIKVPGTEAGIPAIEQLLADGFNVNVTLLFSVKNYEQVMEAYLRGLERRQQAGQPLDRVASVASFFVSRVDSAVDAQLEKLACSGVDDGQAALARAMSGKAAVANAKLAYERFAQVFSGARWERLASAGARVQRPLWASTSTKSPAYRDVIYVEELIGPHTVNTMPLNTVEAFADHGVASRTVDQDVEAAHQDLRTLAELGIDMDAVTDQLQREGVDKFIKSFRELIGSVESKLARVTLGA